jgi:predicted restriction endonuclease
MNTINTVKQKFEEWLSRNGSNSVGKYSGAINTITKELKNNNLIQIEIYLIQDPDEIDEIINKYLSIDELNKKNKRGNNMYTASLKNFKKFLENNIEEKIIKEKNELEIKSIEENIDNLNSLEKESIIKTRIGQSKFKHGLLKIYRKCVLCEIKKHDLLIASHIKPWSVSNNDEKLDLNNGLLLCPLHDKLFDLGYISFDINGNIKISPLISSDEYNSLNINVNARIELKNSILIYMRWHNENIYKS